MPIASSISASHRLAICPREVLSVKPMERKNIAAVKFSYFVCIQSRNQRTEVGNMTALKYKSGRNFNSW